MEGGDDVVGRKCEGVVVGEAHIGMAKREGIEEKREDGEELKRRCGE